MPRTPITIRIVPSRLAWGCQWLLALAVTASVLSHAPGWLGLPALGWLLWLGGWLWRGQAHGELQMQPEAGGGWRWLWRPAAAAEAVPVRLRCAYRGPWLIALDIERRRTWLWPDSASCEARRQLRRALAR
ncbi:hypothetical protein HOP62_01565 [Halomonas sp. MCCC 1A17488]|uniref:hypothetical protein n=1 Tax=unclassified Halomonas TaxID=2609666 RepID=UPI0018D25072|nr:MULTISPECIES: hypothetical protein [unclassified Halomonas]MCE8014762.1 hypothetical protein [Halomonas sp. MCCC 1A17488]MCG3238095.1 hypothetical protein [Halomonas sp. MCCC 1A17488]QPP48131.1 hypothetical protein I4484_12835 [Halomonas sp. SS10-MC5]